MVAVVGRGVKDRRLTAHPRDVAAPEVPVEDARPHLMGTNGPPGWGIQVVHFEGGANDAVGSALLRTQGVGNV